MESVSDQNTESLSELELRRCAIMVGLSSYLSLEENLAAIKVWENDFRNTPKFALHKFVSHIVSGDNRLWELRNGIYRDLIKALVLSRAEIEKQYNELFSDSDNLSDSSGIFPGRDHRLAFKRLYVAYMNTLEAMDFQVCNKLKSYIRDKMLQQHAFNVNRHKLNSWLLGVSAKLEYDISLEESREIIHLLYVGSCQYLGPVKADSLLSQIVRKVESIGAGQEFPVRSLL